MSAQLQELKTKVIVGLYECGALKFGKFKLKSGLESPVYIDLRIIPSFPSLFSSLCSLLTMLGNENNLFTRTNNNNNNADSQLFLCGVPYSALTFASVVAANTQLPSIIVRKEQKTYGTRNTVEGKYNKGDGVLILEDVMTSGASILETIVKIEAEGLEVDNVVVILNRQQLGNSGTQFQLTIPEKQRDQYAKASYPITSCATLDEMVNILLAEKKIETSVAQSIFDYISNNQITEAPQQPAVVTPKELTFEERANLPKANRFSRKLFKLMTEKKSNLCLSADINDPSELIKIIEQVGDEICLLKLHMDVVLLNNEITSYQEVIKRLVELSQKHNFLIFEDRKFADIGNTAQNQYEHGPFQIVQWSHLTNTHLVSGISSVKALSQIAQKYEQADSNVVRGCLVIAEMSTEDSLYSKSELRQTFLQISEQCAEQCPDFVSGFICQGRFIPQEKGAHLLYCTPGVNINASADGLGQIYNSPERVVGELKSDVIIVGRGIYHSSDPKQSAIEFRERGWKAYENRLLQQ